MRVEKVAAIDEPPFSLDFSVADSGAAAFDPSSLVFSPSGSAAFSPSGVDFSPSASPSGLPSPSAFGSSAAAAPAVTSGAAVEESSPGTLTIHFLIRGAIHKSGMQRKVHTLEKKN